MIEIASDQLSATIDPGRGADVLSLVHRVSGLDVMFQTPWRERADRVSSEGNVSTNDSFAGWLEGYRGGWQTLFPVAGAARSIHGAPVGFHGEASTVPWAVDQVSKTSAELHLDVFSVPVRIDRSISVDGALIRISDRLTNTSATELTLDYSHHPAFGGPFLDGECRIDSGATLFSGDAEAPGIVAPDSVHAWPMAAGIDGEQIDLRIIPGPDAHRVAFGWLHDFTEHWMSITNVERDLTVKIEWDGAALPYAWMWQELNGSPEFPWFGRGRVVALEPASTPTSGPRRSSALRLESFGQKVIEVRIGFQEGRA